MMFMRVTLKDPFATPLFLDLPETWSVERRQQAIGEWLLSILPGAHHPAMQWSISIDGPLALMESQR